METLVEKNNEAEAMTLYYKGKSLYFYIDIQISSKTICIVGIMFSLFIKTNSYSKLINFLDELLQSKVYKCKDQDKITANLYQTSELASSLINSLYISNKYNWILGILI